MNISLQRIFQISSGMALWQIQHPPQSRRGIRTKLWLSHKFELFTLAIVFVTSPITSSPCYEHLADTAGSISSLSLGKHTDILRQLLLKISIVMF